MFRLLAELFRAISAEAQRFSEKYLSFQDPLSRSEKQLRILYGRGAISKERYFELRNKLYRGQILRGDLINLRREAELVLEAKGEVFPRYHDPQIGRGLDRLYVDRTLLEEAQAESDHLLKTLASEVDWLREQAEAARQEAQKALPDESAARGYLEIWHDLQERAAGLEQRMGALRQNVQRLNTLQSELSATITELQVLDAQQNLAGVRVKVDQDFVSRR
jgi:prefoldin subunit 5